MTMNRGLPPVVVNCLPKSGTHLISRLFEALPAYRNIGITLTRKTAQRHRDAASEYLVGLAEPTGMKKEQFESQLNALVENHYVHAHLPFSKATQALLERKHCRMILLLRNLKDVVCSFAFYLLKKDSHYLHPYFRSLSDMSSRFRAVIGGIKPEECNDYVSLASIADQVRSLDGWINWPFTQVVFFEQLVGEAGGGSVELQRNAVKKLLTFLDYPLSSPEIDSLCGRLYSSGSYTFRKGNIGDWATQFTEEIDLAFETLAGEEQRKVDRILSESNAGMLA
jgi:hypothetical protein